ncbi:MAG: hypothetical protein IKU11_11940 [Clostridia bacterium]|nr:hypothetical protein [Clostridia bacterium]
MIENPIMPLRGPDRVRKRPNVLFGSNDGEGVAHALALLVKLFALEGRLGNCSCLTITLSPDGSIALESRDTGFAMEDSATWQEIFTRLQPGSQLWDESFSQALAAEQSRLYGRSEPVPAKLLAPIMPFFDLAVVQMASQWMRVESVRHGTLSTLSFRNGYPDGEMTVTPTDAPTGTAIRFRPAPEIFTELSPSLPLLRRFLWKAADEAPGLRCILRIN